MADVAQEQEGRAGQGRMDVPWGQGPGVDGADSGGTRAWWRIGILARHWARPSSQSGAGGRGGRRALAIRSAVHLEAGVGFWAGCAAAVAWGRAVGGGCTGQTEF